MSFAGEHQQHAGVGERLEESHLHRDTARDQHNLARPPQHLCGHFLQDQQHSVGGVTLNTQPGVCVCACLCSQTNVAQPHSMFCCTVTQAGAARMILFTEMAAGCQVLSELMQNKPDEMMTVAGLSVMMFDQLQNQTSLWESLLDLPQLFSNGSVDQGLRHTEVLLTNIQG